jgi:pyruvate-formate lyase-activating enzyme
MLDIPIIDSEKVRAVEWTGDSVQYDIDLYNLEEDKGFLVLNPWLSDTDLNRYVTEIPKTDQSVCVIWKCGNEWVAKYFPEGWRPELGYQEVKVAKPKFTWRKNADLDRTMVFENDPFAVYEPEIWDNQYELIWYMDPRFNPLPDRVWAISCKPMGVPVKGTKDMGYVTPRVNIEFNPELPEFDLDLDSLFPPYYDLANECAYMLDPVHSPYENVWVVKFTPAYRKSKPLMWLGTISPEFEVIYNKDLPKMEYEVNYDIPWRDLKYTHMWFLDKKHYPEQAEDIWAVKIKTGKKSKGTKLIGSLSPVPTIELNPNLPELAYNIEYIVPHYDLSFEHVWMLDRQHTVSAPEDIWAVKISYTRNLEGTKIIDFVSPVARFEYNSDLPQLKYEIDYFTPYHDLGYEHVWMLDKVHTDGLSEDIWAVKMSYTDVVEGTKNIGSLSPIPTVIKNPEIPNMEYDLDYIVPYHDLNYEQIWIIDKRHFKGVETDDVWAVKWQYVDEPEGSKYVGAVSPTVTYTANPHLPALKYDIQYDISFYDFEYEHVWMLDPKHCKDSVEEVYAIKSSVVKKPKGSKVIETVSPKFKTSYNRELRGYSWPDTFIDDIQYHDMKFTNVWMLDKEYSKDFDIWAVRINFVDEPEGYKEQGFVSPATVVEINRDLPYINYDIDYVIPYYDKQYVHTWYLDPEYNPTKDKIWAVRLKSGKQASGEKDMGYITPSYAEKLDVFFISYAESNAEQNWNRVLEKAPWAQRIHGVKGIFEAHKKAAALANTDMFYVVDGDAWLVDDWNFDFKPNIFDRDCTYIWRSVNPINGLTYGHGGVKLFPRLAFEQCKEWKTLDLSTTINSKLKIEDKISNESRFNTDEFSTWRTAFREVVKLSTNSDININIKEHNERVQAWLNKGQENKYGKYALLGAEDAIKFVKDNESDDTLLKINDLDWLKEEFDRTHKISGKNMSDTNYDRIQMVIPIINNVSPTFCLAKWYHVTLYLQTGENHSCYHPPPHFIAPEDIKNNPSGLHNTRHKKIERLEMQRGVQTKGCQYCWNIENMGDTYISDRHIKSATIYNPERLEAASKKKWTQNIDPEYVEISFGNECNFKCGYCHPKASSRFYNEIKEFGPVTTVKNHRCDIDWLKIYEREEDNPYVDAWWEWWPTLKKSLTILRITGGEPLMHTSTWKLFEDLNRDPVPKLELNVNSNLGIKHAMVQRMVKEVNNLIDNKGIKRFKLFTSIDTWGPRAEYARTGLDLELWEKNLDYYLTETGQPISFMITFNILAVTTFKSLLEKILEWRVKYNKVNKTDQFQMVRFDTPYLKEPLQYDINILPKEEFLPYMYESLKFIEDNTDDLDPNKFSKVEFERFNRVVKYMESTTYDDAALKEGRRDFYNWFSALDQRRNINFVETFPEMESFFLACKKLNG